MGSVLFDGLLPLCSPIAASSSSSSSSLARHARGLPLTWAAWASPYGWRKSSLFVRHPASRPMPLVAFGSSFQTDNPAPINSDAYKVGDFMTKKENLKTVKPSTTIDEALEILVEHRITGLPVVDDAWVLVGVVSDYDLLALDSISGHRETGTDLFPEADRSWKMFNEVQRMLLKTVGRVVGDVMTTTPIVVRETTNLEDAARLLLETRYRRLPVLDSSGKLVGIITRGNVVGAALHIKREMERR
ncbi:CBS domain-containing protein CBSX2, chloroplastic-like [Wolffia australiana]